MASGRHEPEKCCEDVPMFQKKTRKAVDVFLDEKKKHGFQRFKTKNFHNFCSPVFKEKSTNLQILVGG